MTEDEARQMALEAFPHNQGAAAAYLDDLRLWGHVEDPYKGCSIYEKHGDCHCSTGATFGACGR